MADITLRAAIAEVLLNDSDEGVRLQESLLGVYDALQPVIMENASLSEVVGYGRSAVEFAMWDCAFTSMYTRWTTASPKFKEAAARHPKAIALLNQSLSGTMAKLTSLRAANGLKCEGMGVREADEALRQFNSMMASNEPNMEDAGADEYDEDDDLMRELEGDAYEGEDTSETAPIPETTPVPEEPTDEVMALIRNKANWQRTRRVKHQVWAIKAPAGQDIYNTLEDADYMADEEKCIVLSGTCREQYVVHEREFLTRYTDINGNPLGDISKLPYNPETNGWLKVQAVSDGRTYTAYALRIPIKYRDYKLTTARGDVLTINPTTSLYHDTGDYLVCDMDESSGPALDSIRVVNHTVFVKTYSVENFLGEVQKSGDAPEPSPLGYVTRRGIAPTKRDDYGAHNESVEPEDVEHSDPAEDSESHEHGTENHEQGTEETDDMEANNPVYRRVLRQLAEVWGGMYEPQFNNTERVNGFLVPKCELGPAREHKTPGGMLVNDKDHIRINTGEQLMANVLWSCMAAAAKAEGEKVVYTVGHDPNKVLVGQYNPLLQRAIASGALAGGRDGAQTWTQYIEKMLDRLPALKRRVQEVAREVERTGRQELVDDLISQVSISMAVVNYTNKIGGQLRVSFGCFNRPQAVAQRFAELVNYNEKHGETKIWGREFIIEGPYMQSGNVALYNFFYQKDLYYNIPMFLSSFLNDMRGTGFKPSLRSIIIGRKLDNSPMTMDLTGSGEGSPIIAAPRSGKGVLTLDILANAMALKVPMFYFDSKPDMAIQMWQMAAESGVQQPMVIDGAGQLTGQFINDASKGYSAPYAEYIRQAQADEQAAHVLRSMYGPMLYVKLLAVTWLCQKYKQEPSATKWHGQLMVVVLDELVTAAGAIADTIKALKDEQSELKKQKHVDQEAVNGLNKIIRFMQTTMGEFTRARNQMFNSGIKVFGLGQPVDAKSYNDIGAKDAESGDFAKIYGFTGTSNKTVALQGALASERGDRVPTFTQPELKELVNKKRHFFAVQGAVTQGFAVTPNMVFRPMLVLNENSGYYRDNLLKNVDDSAKETVVEIMDSPLTGPGVGFKGAIGMVAEAINDWNPVDVNQVIAEGMNIATELATDALTYYGVIGQPGINSVYDYLCSMNPAHFWRVTEIAAGLSNVGAAGDEEGLGIGIDPSEIPDGDAVIDLGDIGAPAESDEGDYSDLLGDLESESGDWASQVSSPEPTPARPMGTGTTPANPVVRAPVGPAGAGDVFDSGILADGEVAHVDYGEEARAARELREAEQEAVERARQRVDWDEIPDHIVESAERNIFDAIPDGGDVLDVVAHLLVDDVRSGACEPALAEAIARRHNLLRLGYIDSYDFHGPVHCLHEGAGAGSVPVEVVQSQVAATGAYGKAERFIRITAENSRNASSLTTENSVDCSGAAYRPTTRLEGLLMRSPVGAEWYAKRLWKDILNEIISEGFRRGSVTRVSLLAGHMYVNGKIIRLDGIVGGVEGLRLCDLVDFPYMLKQFPMLSELRIDDEMMRMAVLQYPKEDNPFTAMFAKHKRLNLIVIKRQQGSIKFDRAAMEQKARMDYAHRMTQEAQVRNAVDAQCAAQRTRTWKRSSMADNLRSVRACKDKATAAGKNFWRKNKTGVIATGACLGLCALSLPIGILAFAVRAGWKSTTSAVKDVKKR